MADMTITTDGEPHSEEDTYNYRAAWYTQAA